MLMHRLTPGDTANAYTQFHITFWIDRFLLATTVFAPLVTAIFLIVLQAIVDLAKCHLPTQTQPSISNSRQADYLNRYCSLQLANNILQGRQDNRPKGEQGSLQHEYYPFLLLISAVLLWIPHAVYHQAVNRPLRRNLVLVRNELQNFRENTMRELNRRGQDSETNLVDFSASVTDLPLLPSCKVEWSLSYYLSSWQRTDYFCRRYFTKHIVIFLLQTIVFVAVFCVLCVHSGAPFAPIFLCFLPKTLVSAPSGISGSSPSTECVIQSTFVVNISVVILYLCNIASILSQIAFFYTHFSQSRFTFEEDRYFDSCFFGPYIRLLSYSLFREMQKIHDFHISLSPGFLRTDFHMMALMCSENQDHLTDAFFVHYWTERFLRANRKRQYITSGTATSASAHSTFQPTYSAAASRFRRASFGLLKCEDVTEKLNFSMMRLKVEINDLLW